MDKLLQKHSNWHSTWHFIFKITVGLIALPILLQTGGVNAQERPVTISGKVFDANNATALAGVNILEKGTGNGSISDVDGNYKITVNEGATLLFSLVGYLKSEVAITDEKMIDVALLPEDKALDEVVVVGYGTQKKVNLTGAVANVQMSSLVNRPITNSSVALQGTIPGVYALQRSGKPGADNAVINIRGVGTLNNSDPLVLIDGFPGSMGDVSAQDIESISVLKDASSAAIYGNRAANGVILITTKRGSSGKVSIAYNNYFGTQAATSLPEVLTSVEYATFHNEAARNTGIQPKYSQTDIDKYAAQNDPLYPSIAYFDVYYGRAAIQNHRLNLSGGSESLQYAFMLGSLDQEGILIGTKYNKLDFRSNFDAHLLKDKKLRLSARLSGNRGMMEEPTDEGSARWYATNSPIWPLRDEQTGNWYATNGERNYYGEIMEGSLRKIARYQFNAQLNAEYEIFSGLKAELIYGANVTTANNTGAHAGVSLYQPNGTIAQTLTSDLTEINDLHTQTLFTALVKYNKAFNRHQFDFLAGYSEEEFSWRMNAASRTGFVNNTQWVLNLGSPSTQQNNGSAHELGLRSIFGRINYIFADRYLFEANVRRDGSSRFGEGNKTGAFPSFSAGWIISEENFLNDVQWLDALKIRGSWGQLGNQNINSFYAASDILASGANYSFGGALAAGVAQTTLSNKETTWETSEQTNIGADISLFNNFNITIDYFDKLTKNILMQVPIPITMGNLVAPFQNVGGVRNSGVEFSGNYRKVFGNGLRLDATLNLSHVTNKITTLNGRSPIILSPKAMVEGYAINSFYGYKMDGIYQISDFTWQNNSDQNIPHDDRNYTLKDGVVSVANYNALPGDIKYQDIDGDGRVTMDRDRIILGKQFPDLTYSLQLNTSFKQFDLGLFLQGVRGIQGYSYYEIATPFAGFSNLGSWWRERWTPENTTNTLPRFTLDSERRQIPSSFYMEDASYFRLKNIELGYSISDKICSLVGISKFRIYGNVQNALTISKFKGFDPEQPVTELQSQAFPQVRIFTMGVNLNF